MRVHEDMRGSGRGRDLLQWAFNEASERGCVMVQLTCDRARSDAHRFYQALGFSPTHTGFKRKPEVGFYRQICHNAVITENVIWDEVECVGRGDTYAFSTSELTYHGAVALATD
ncbi:GNAT family N-acetyltransferase [Pseudomonas putida]